ncbi:hypothetical protein LARI1_G004587 [Lachnellula arida]|uniref:Uncharacterized protein n=1 Tax=Lachnellula arida TaxID=1316785 RepID=A0A8T9B7D1_9HELO|nr:hypothetical protein LARI1_G004587 [Lachnellula arida]
MPSATGTGEKPSNPSNTTPDSSNPSSGAAQTVSNTTSHTKTEAEEAADRLYEERIEDEFKLHRLSSNLSAYSFAQVNVPSDALALKPAREETED